MKIEIHLLYIKLCVDILKASCRSDKTYNINTTYKYTFHELIIVIWLIYWFTDPWKIKMFVKPALTVVAHSLIIIMLTLKTRSMLRKRASEPYETSVSAAMMTPPSNFRPITELPVVMGPLPIRGGGMKSVRLGYTFVIYVSKLHVLYIPICTVSQITVIQNTYADRWVGSCGAPVSTWLLGKL